ncbi:LacI family DNA-binding transcriptional regulator [Ferrimonas balearica]|uniref:LacI family DNA-binding transcriptional regulator n=1 Tax=Ferrimonas balearica TaxID=44012 RepID=UPI001C9862D9|nr:substrate-binding domain-containing protein [Ferrimonas balearica]MBY5980013.1 substrate-binding domain-containing protein [Ferrimonas balearica]
MATIKDVARLAGVSTTTVSHVLNETRFVSEDAKARVMQAVAALNYVPNTVARSLKGGSSRVLGMLVTDTNNPFYADLIQWVDRVAYRHGYNLMLCNTQGNADRARDYLAMLAQRRVDGMLLMSSDTQQETMADLSERLAMPAVVMDSAPAEAGYDRILDDSEMGGELAVTHLIEQGHQRIGLLAGPLSKRNSQSRLSGYRHALTKAGLAADDNWVCSDELSFEGGYRAMHALLARKQQLTAVFASNDLMAMGAMRALMEAGLRVPEDVSVVGYDDIPAARYCNPPLTTVRQPMEALAEQALSMLLDRIREPSLPGRQVVLPPALVGRDSVAPVN